MRKKIKFLDEEQVPPYILDVCNYWNSYAAYGRLVNTQTTPIKIITYSEYGIEFNVVKFKKIMTKFGYSRVRCFSVEENVSICDENELWIMHNKQQVDTTTKLMRLHVQINNFLDVHSTMYNQEIRPDVIAFRHIEDITNTTEYVETYVNFKEKTF